MSSTFEVRQTFADDMFLRRHRGLGSPVVNQFVWRFGTALPTGAVERFAVALARGSLGRRAVPAMLPGARGRWYGDPTVPPIAHRERPLAGDGVRGWIDRVAAVDLDPAAGPAWRLATAPTAAGGTLVSLVVAHAAADGGAMVDAIVRAASWSAPLGLPAASGRTGGARGVQVVARLRDVVPDLRDAVGQGREIAGWVTDRVVDRARAAVRPADAEVAPADPVAPTRDLPPDSGDWRPSWVVAELDATAVEEMAAARGGTVNAWFVALTAGLVRRTGRHTDTDVPVALPVSTRAGDDLRGNATRIARVLVTPQQSSRRRLDAVRDSCKAAYAALGEAREPVPLALVQMLPDAVVRRLPPPPAAAALASNVGALPDGFATLGGVRAEAVFAVAHQQGLDVAEAAASGGGLVLFLVRTGDRLALTVVACDPFAVRDGAVLTDLVSAELATWQADGHDLRLRVW
ncbi:hypothetical protein [Nocardioides sambongensis]|uniref:hypothetical protein n=1 Tax=Nocardioides sambongensis TaxID=2589074 RepID=UPI00112841F8|nr:hypothetical protein [Nocardioides sambongensis]